MGLPSETRNSAERQGRRRSLRLPSAARNTLLFGGLLLLALIVSPFLGIGGVSVPPADVIAVALHHLTGGLLASNECPVPLVYQGHTDPCSAVDVIVWTNAMPTFALAVLVGAGLALAGGTMQGVFRNPLGDPYLLGISSGAALGAALATVGIGTWATYENVLLPLMAFLGAMAISFVVLVASRSGRSSTETLLLTGVALGAFVASLLEILIISYPRANLTITFWILGSFGAPSWGADSIVALGVVAGGIVLVLHGRDLNLLQLGDESARGLGGEVSRIRTRLLLVASVLTGACVAFSGIIGFVGLVSPHVVRRLQGPNYRSLLPVSALFGGLFLLTAYDLSETVPGFLFGSGTIVPVGIITSFIGGPFFLWILYRRRRRDP